MAEILLDGREERSWLSGGMDKGAVVRVVVTLESLVCFTWLQLHRDKLA